MRWVFDSAKSLKLVVFENSISSYKLRNQDIAGFVPCLKFPITLYCTANSKGMNKNWKLTQIASKTLTLLRPLEILFSWQRKSTD